MKLLIVESPSKVKVLSKYLDSSQYKVIATYGHIQQIMPKKMAIDTKNNFSVQWNIKRKLKIDTKKYQEFVLATDPDREGEAIAWHVVSLFKPKKVSRISFNSITKKSLHDALKNPRNIDTNLVDSYLARIKLDYLMGFSISPILWRKLPGTKSAGRVQSPALRIIVERELLIKQFVPKEYWEIYMYYKGNKIQLEKYNEEKIIYDISCFEKIQNYKYKVSNITKTKRSVSSKAPFITSTLQQTAFNELGFSPEKTMSIAQNLYEGKNEMCEGLITYMRTDSTNIDAEFMNDLRKYVFTNYNDLFEKKEYKTKAKNAQEAHEAIRIVNLTHTPESIKEILSPDQFLLYKLIWNRTISSLMKNSIYESTKYTISEKNAVFSISCSNLIFKGYQFYREVENKSLNLKINENIVPEKWEKIKKFTLPPKRYSQASLINELERMGIGRPSTYAHIVKVLKERDYVNEKFIPNNKGIIVCTFLKTYFEKYIQYDFTTKMEEDLDKISNGIINSIDLLSNFWKDFSKNIEKISKIKITSVLEGIQNELNGKLWPQNIKCCKSNMLLKTGKGYPFLHCTQCTKTYCLFTQKYVQDEILFQYKKRNVIRKHRINGAYLEWINENNKKITLPNISEEDFKRIVEIMESGFEYLNIKGELKCGPFGFYLSYNNKNISIPKTIDIFKINNEQIYKILENKNVRDSNP